MNFRVEKYLPYVYTLGVTCNCEGKKGEKMDEKKRLAELHMRARYDAGKSQEYIALEMGVSKKTVANWEKGISTPDIFDSFRWFEALHLNPMPYYLDFLLGPTILSAKGSNDEENVDRALNDIIANLPINSKRALLFLLHGNHGSSPNAVIQMMLAHLHTPIKDRVIQSEIIAREYEMEKRLGNLICTDCILPDMEVLNLAIDEGRNSAEKGEYGYVLRLQKEKQKKEE